MQRAQSTVGRARALERQLSNNKKKLAKKQFLVCELGKALSTTRGHSGN